MQRGAVEVREKVIFLKKALNINTESVEMAGYWPQHLPPLTTGETEDSGLQELPCGQGRDRFDSFINQLVLLSRCHIIKGTQNIEFKCSVLSGISDTVMSLSSQIIEDLIISSDSTTM